jgi:uncharacterized protein (DUF697 family)
MLKKHGSPTAASAPSAASSFPSTEPNPYLSDASSGGGGGDDSYVAAAGEFVLTEGAAGGADARARAESADDGGGFEEDPGAAKVQGFLRQVFRGLVASTGGGSKELGKAEFDLLGQLVGLESPKKLRTDVLSAVGQMASTGLVLRNFLRGFTSKGLPTPGTGSVPSAVWAAVAAPTMGQVLGDTGKRELLETELSRWVKAIGKFGEEEAPVKDEREGGGGGGGGDDGDENSFGDEDDEDDEDYEPWQLGGSDIGAYPDAQAMKLKYAIQGRKQGEEDLGEGRAGVVRKCIEVGGDAAAADAGAAAGAVVVRACKCISKRQQSLEETERELAIMRKLVGVAGVSQLVDVFEAPDRLFVVSELCEGGEL